MQNKEKMIFRYSCTPSCGCFGVSDGGFSIELYTDGEFVYKTYIFDYEEKQKIKLKLPINIAKEIMQELVANQSRLDSIPNRLDNGSFDGSCNWFVFFNKEIIDYNIQFNNEEEIKKYNPTYFEAYREVIIQENIILEIFDKVVKKLKLANIELTLHSVNIKNSSN